MKGILAVNNLGYIGLNSGLPWRSKADFAHFVERTAGQTLMVGWNTLQTLPYLAGRRIILAMRFGDGPDIFNEYVYTDKSYKFLAGNISITEVDWCIGGKATYERFCGRFTELHVSHIDNNTIGDTVFPDFGELNPQCAVFNYYFKGAGEYVLNLK